MNKAESKDFITGRLRATLTPSKNPDEWVTLATLCTLYGYSRAVMLDCALEAHFTDDDNGKVKAKWRLPL